MMCWYSLSKFDLQSSRHSCYHIIQYPPENIPTQFRSTVISRETLADTALYQRPNVLEVKRSQKFWERWGTSLPGARKEDAFEAELGETPFKIQVDGCLGQGIKVSRLIRQRGWCAAPENNRSWCLADDLELA